MTKRNRNKNTEAVRLSIPVVDLVRVMADLYGVTFKEMMSKIVREWAEKKVKK